MNDHPAVADAFDTELPLPAQLRRRKLQLNGTISLAMAAIAMALFVKQSVLVGSILLIATLLSVIRFWRLRSARHVTLRNGLLQCYDPHMGIIHAMPITEIGSIQFRAGSARNLIKLPDRFIVRSNRFERELEVFVLTDAQRPLLTAFFRRHFPEQYQEPVTHLPGFPPARE